jgi:hypothetical protein
MQHVPRDGVQVGLGVADSFVVSGLKQSHEDLLENIGHVGGGMAELSREKTA